MTTISPCLMLTHVGHRRLLALQRATIVLDDDTRVMAEMSVKGVLDVASVSCADALIANGWAMYAPFDFDTNSILLGYRRNPLENVTRVNFEVTTQCNFACQHCRNGDVKVTRERNIPALEAAGRIFLSLGIRRFDFIGGEVTRYGKGWLDLVDRLRGDDAADVLSSAWPDPLGITVYTNGWWIGGTDFDAAGKHYADEAAFLSDLREHGVSHILFSIDGPPERHDAWRGHPGLYQRILDVIPRVKAAGILPRLSVILKPDDTCDFILPFAEAIYEEGEKSLQAFFVDTYNHVSNFIDSGRAAHTLRVGMYPLSAITPEMMRCKAFFRPSPTLRIMANGEIGICPLMLGEEGYGNLHDQPLVNTLNRLHEAPLYRLHASGRIGEYLSRIDRAKFANGIDHPCALRIEVNRLALADTHSLNEHMPIPVSPTLRRTPSLFERAAETIMAADSLIITAGAGMGVDSGLPDFRGNEGFWKAYPALAKSQISFAEIACPDAFESNPNLAWGFYGHRLNLYRNTQPHNGFQLLLAIARHLDGGAFVYTSNVDGQLQKAGFPLNNIVECHGSIHHLQCQQDCYQEIWEATKFKPEVDEEHCLLTSSFPTCRHCGGIARPNILMFGDWHWDGSRTASQMARFCEWRDTVYRPVVIEIGAGMAIPTVREFGERQVVPLIRINPTYAEVSRADDVSLEMGALSAITAIAKCLVDMGFAGNADEVSFRV